MEYHTEVEIGSRVFYIQPAPQPENRVAVKKRVIVTGST